MSFVDLATLTLHRRYEMEARINVFANKCDHAMNDILKLKLQAQSFVHQLNCEPSELKDRFLTCMSQLDEYIYLITDFNLSVGKYAGQTGSLEYTPVQDSSETASSTNRTYVNNFNIMDILSESKPSTSMACPNLCPVQKTRKFKILKEDQQLIQFSSSSSSESVPQVKIKVEVEKTEKEGQCELVERVQNVKVTESVNLPAQNMLQVDQKYPAFIMNIDGASLWVITDDLDQVYRLMTEMAAYYMKNHVTMSLEEVASLTYCAFYDYDSNTHYRGLFVRLIEEQTDMAEVFLVDTGEVRTAKATECLQPLLGRFCELPPFARLCHLAGMDLINYDDQEITDKQEEFMKQHIGKSCTIEIDDNISESLGVYVLFSDGETLNYLLVKEGFAYCTTPEKQATSKASSVARSIASPPKYIPPEMAREEIDIADCPEFEDPVEAVTGYSCRDEVEICRHYKGGLDKTCFKGARCKKKHIKMHPDGWTLDKVQVAGAVPPASLPAPGTWHEVQVTCVQHYDALYVQFHAGGTRVRELPQFGVVLPPETLEDLVRDMNSPATIMAYKPLKMVPAPGELVAALYPMDGMWYRARVLSSTRPDQSVEVIYIDYGNAVWVKEDEVRSLEARHLHLPCQATRCVLAGVSGASGGQTPTGGPQSALWEDAKKRLGDMTLGRTLQLHVIARDYDELTVEIFNEKGYSITEQLAALKLITLRDYNVTDDTNVRQKLVVP